MCILPQIHKVETINLAIYFHVLVHPGREVTKTSTYWFRSCLSVVASHCSWWDVRVSCISGDQALIFQVLHLFYSIATIQTAGWIWNLAWSSQRTMKMNIHSPWSCTKLPVALTPPLNKAALTVLVSRTLSVFLDQHRSPGYLFFLGRIYVPTTQFGHQKLKFGF